MQKPLYNWVVITVVVVLMTTICQAQQPNLMDKLAGAPPKKSSWEKFSDSVSSGVKSGWSAITKPFDSLAGEPKQDDPTSIETRAEPSTELYFAAARSFEERNLLRDAEKQYQRALKESPTHLGSMLGYGRLLDRQGRFAEAVQLYNKAIEAHPKSTVPLNYLSLCLASHGMLNEAASTLEKAIRLEPKKALHRNNIAIILVEMGQNAAAFSHLRAVHDEATAYYNLGCLLEKRGDSPAAMKHFEMALRRDPKFEEAKRWFVHLQNKMRASNQQPPMVARRPRVANQQPVGNRANTASGMPTLNQQAPGVGYRPEQRNQQPYVNRAGTAPDSTAPPVYPQSTTLHQPTQAVAPEVQNNPLRRDSNWPGPVQATPANSMNRDVRFAKPYPWQNSQSVNRNDVRQNQTTAAPPAARQQVRTNSAPGTDSGSPDPNQAAPEEAQSPQHVEPGPALRSSYPRRSTNVVYPLPPVE